MNNADCYALEAKAKYIYDSDQEEEYQFHGPHIFRTQKSMTMMSSKQVKPPKQTQMKKSNSFLLTNKVQAPAQVRKPNIEIKHKSKGSKKCLNMTEGCKKPGINSKNSLAKTSVSIGNISSKSAKTSKDRSISRDYLIINSHIYSCENIEQVNERLVCGHQPLYSHGRFMKSTLKNQGKIRTYVLAFLDYFKYSQIRKVNVGNLTFEQKKKLYMLLKSQPNQSGQTTSQCAKETFSIKQLIKQAYRKIEQKTSAVIIDNPKHLQEVENWKKVQLHQLKQIQSCLDESKINSYEAIPSPGYPTLGEGNSEPRPTKLERVKNSYRIEQKFPTCLEPKSKTHITAQLTEEHILSKLGIEKFLQNLWDFLVDSESINLLILKLRSSYGLSRANKLKAIRQASVFWEWGRELDDYQILGNEYFINFCKQKNLLNQQKQVIDAELGQVHEKAAIIFYKAIFDALNQQLLKFQADFPHGCFHPLESNLSNSAYLIDQTNAMLVWDECMNQIIKSHELRLGLLCQSKNEEVSAPTKKHNQWSLKYQISQQFSVSQWQSLMFLSKRLAYEALLLEVEQHLWQEATDEIGSF